VSIGTLLSLPFAQQSDWRGVSSSELEELEDDLLHL
jgi:hypothetical protein